jgi:hypothetical protein
MALRRTQIFCEEGHAMKRWQGLVVLLMGSTLMAGTANARGSLGAGLHYLRNLGDITDNGVNDLSQDSFGLIGSYQLDMRMLKIEGNVEYIFDYVGTGNEMWEPSVYGLLGLGALPLYAGAGIGIGYTNDEWMQNPFYALRAGVNIPLSKIGLDFYATYRFQSDTDLKNLTGEDLDSLTFAGVVRFGM